MITPEGWHPMNWLHKLRLRAFAVLVASVFGALAVVGWLSVPVLPALGVAIITAAAVVNSMASRLALPTCAGCGIDLTQTPADAHGVTCPDCGTINQHFNESRLASIADQLKRSRRDA